MTVILALIARLFGVTPAAANIIAIMAAITIALGSAWGGYELIKHWGAEEVRDQIEDQNNEAGIKGGEARLSYDDCVDRGGLYDFRRGVCTGIAPGGR